MSKCRDKFKSVLLNVDTTSNLIMIERERERKIHRSFHRSNIDVTDEISDI